LCVLPPLHRTPAQATGGTGVTPDCTGALRLEFEQVIASGDDPLLHAGRTVYAQYWFRDPAATFESGLTEGLTFTICP
jgi:hypothetical protein